MVTVCTAVSCTRVPLLGTSAHIDLSPVACKDKEFDCHPSATNVALRSCRLKGRQTLPSSVEGSLRSLGELAPFAFAGVQAAPKSVPPLELVPSSKEANANSQTGLRLRVQ